MSSYTNDTVLLTCGAALQVVWLLSAVLAPPGEVFWRFAALTALMVAFLHGGLFWIIRRRQQALAAEAAAERQRAIADIREQLSDVVGNHLAVIDLSLQEGRSHGNLDQHLQAIRTSVAGIALQVEGLSEESLEMWQGSYASDAYSPSAEPEARVAV